MIRLKGWWWIFRYLEISAIWLIMGVIQVLLIALGFSKRDYRESIIDWLMGGIMLSVFFLLVSLAVIILRLKDRIVAWLRKANHTPPSSGEIDTDGRT